MQNHIVSPQHATDTTEEGDTTDAKGKKLPTSVNTKQPADPNKSADSSKPETPRLPHEHDESVGSTDGTPSEHMQQGYEDVQRGLKDTSRAPEADKAYRKLKN